jgi:hypothetical protein
MIKGLSTSDGAASRRRTDERNAPHGTGRGAAKGYGFVLVLLRRRRRRHPATGTRPFIHSRITKSSRRVGTVLDRRPSWFMARELLRAPIAWGPKLPFPPGWWWDLGMEFCLHGRGITIMYTDLICGVAFLLQEHGKKKICCKSKL